jgi:hypothetical protein
MSDPILGVILILYGCGAFCQCLWDITDDMWGKLAIAEADDEMQVGVRDTVQSKVVFMQFWLLDFIAPPYVAQMNGQGHQALLGRCNNMNF